MKHFAPLWTIFCFWILVSTAPLACADGPHGSGPAPELGSDLAVQLQIPLFDKAFADLPVASLGSTPVLLKELWPSLKNSKNSKELSKSFKQALEAHIAKNSGITGPVEVYVDTNIGENQLLSVDVPLFTESFSNVPVALVNEDPITVAEFSKNLQSVHNEMAGSDAASGAKENARRLMDRLVTVRLIEQEARNIGFDQTSSFQKQATEFAEKTLLYALLNKQLEGETLDTEAADELYRQVSLEGTFRNYLFRQEKDVVALLEAYKKGEDFDALIAEALAKKQAVEEIQAEYIRFKDLLPNIASEAAELEVGEVSQIFRQADGFLIFKLVQRRFVEDPQALAYAQKNVWERQRAEFAAKYITDTVDRYAQFNEEAEADLDFVKIKEANPDIKLGEALQPLLKDQRVLVTINGPTQVKLTVADLAGKIKDNYFHGVDVPLDAREVNTKKVDILDETLFRIAGTFEAQKLGLDQTEKYRMDVAEFERRLLFDIFTAKVVTPEVQYGEEEVQAYYALHQEDYMTPAMLRFKSLPFYRKVDAENAAEKLRSGSDVKWVSANSEGLVDVQNKDLLQFDRNLLSLSSLPESLQEQAAEVKRGDTLVYAEADNYYYVLYLEDVFTPEVRPYDQVRSDILALVYQEKIAATLDEWVRKLKEAYETRIFLSV
ncbi:MAG: peptidyl-prolyl cis-trans isomerase [Desulfuromonas sp.]